MVQIPSFELVPVALATSGGRKYVVHPGYAVFDEAGNIHIGVTLGFRASTINLISSGGYWWVGCLPGSTKLREIALRLPEEILRDVETLVSGK